MSKTDFHKVRGIADVINVSFEFTKENMKGLIKSVAYISGPFILVGSLVYGYFMYSTYAKTLYKLGGNSVNLPPNTSIAVEVFLMAITLLLAYFFFYSAVYEYINLYVKEGLTNIQISDVWRAIRKDLWLMVKTVLGLVLMFIITLILFGVALAIVMAISSAFSVIMGPVVIFIMILPMYAFLFYLLSPYSLIFNVRINERRRFFDSVDQCHKLISGNRLRTLGVIFLGFVVQIMLGFILSLPNYIITIINLMNPLKNDLGWLTFVSAGLLLIVSFVIGIIPIVAINIQYFNLLERKHAPALLSKIEGLGSTPTVAHSGNEETY